MEDKPGTLSKRSAVVLLKHSAWTIFFALSCLASTFSLKAQYISEIIEYVPAPNQYMNTMPWCTPSSPESIIGKIDGSVCLGAFGGYIVFRFADVVENDPDNPYGVDFSIFGNPMENWSEPGIVSVMKDENGNGLPDDTWYELAGSDHYFSSTISNYEVTYTNPGGDNALDVPWTDNFGNSGYILANSFFSQPYYPMADSFPNIDENAYTLSGTRIASTIDSAYAEAVNSYQRAFGYVDNHFRGAPPYTLPDNPYTRKIENSGGDAFDISWAIDEHGDPVNLDAIDFVKVHTAVMSGAGWLGQVTTEITGAVDVAPADGISGEQKCLVIREIPPVLETSSIQLEVFVFEKGRRIYGTEIQWDANMYGATVDDNNMLHVQRSGELTVTASLTEDEAVNGSVSTKVLLATGANSRMQHAEVNVFPNPCSDHITIREMKGAVLRIYTLSGTLVFQKHLGTNSETIPTESLLPGIYLFEGNSDRGSFSGKFIRN